jgi:hypothetical protein
MKKINKIIIGLTIILTTLVGGVFAFQNSQMIKSINSKVSNQVENLFETGNYEDLKELRKELGFEIMFKVQSEKDFIKQKIFFEEMQKNKRFNNFKNMEEHKNEMFKQRINKGDCFKNGN